VMRTLSIAALALLGIGTGLAGCGSGGPDPVPTGTPVAEATVAAKATLTPTAKAAADAKDPVTVKGAVGTPLILRGSGLNDDPNDHRKTRVKVTVLGVRGPFAGFEEPKGRQLIGVDVEFENLGRLRYDEAQPQGQLTVAGGETGKQTSLIPLGGKNPCDNKSLKLRTGQAKRTCIAFDVPAADKPRVFEYVADLGYGDTGLWKLH
jgi:hypothetical protein